MLGMPHHLFLALLFSCPRWVLFWSWILFLSFSRMFWSFYYTDSILNHSIIWMVSETHMSGSFSPSALLNNLLCGYTCVIWPTYSNCPKTFYCMSESQFVFPSFQPRTLVCFPCLITNTVLVNVLRRGWFFVSVCRNSLQDKCLLVEVSHGLCEALASADTTEMLCGDLFMFPSACLTFFFLPYPFLHLEWTD